MSEKHIGIDVGSTTVKIAIIDPADQKLLYAKYERHNAEQAKKVQELLRDAHLRYPNDTFTIAFCGSAGHTFATLVQAHFIQEVVANTVAVKKLYPQTRVAIELGGQDAKVIFFEYDETRNQLAVHDMRMNGSCAGGTGAFIDQVSELLNIKTEEFNTYASRGNTLYEISGRCGVFAKTDIQPLLNQGVSKEDIALSAFHALAKQTIGGLAQGMQIKPKVIFEGGPLTFNPRLVEVFKQRLVLEDDDIIIPDHPETIVAYGAALSVASMFADQENRYDREVADTCLEERIHHALLEEDTTDLAFFKDDTERDDFFKRHQMGQIPPLDLGQGQIVKAYIGIDAGSTTSKFILLNEDEQPIYSYYTHNKGEPLNMIIQGFKDLREVFEKKGARLEVLGVGTTGYGENLFAKAFSADYHNVETVAHARAAQKYAPEVRFILDIGGQDMKAISLNEGIVSEIVLNEACSAGCGSFVETYAGSLGVPVQDIANLAFNAKQPSRLGSRCTVFMNSSIITEQKNGKSSADILAGICRSIIDNVFTKVVRISNWSKLGSNIMVQGGTFKNDAVLRAMEQYIGREVVRSPYPGEMGAIGIALLTKQYMQTKQHQTGEEKKTSFIGLENLDGFAYKKSSGVICRLCGNNCARTIIEFSDGKSYVTGNRCEKGEVTGDLHDQDVRNEIKRIAEKDQSIPDMMVLQEQLLCKEYPHQTYVPAKDTTIGLPRALEFWNSMPFWRTLFSSLGFKVVLSEPSSYHLFDRSLAYIPSDTVCFPAKLVHGHIEDLCDKHVDRIFFPQMSENSVENSSAEGSFYCAIVNGYSMVASMSNETVERYGISIDHPLFHWVSKHLKEKQICDYFEKTFGIERKTTTKAILQANRIFELYREELQAAGQKALEQVEKSGRFGVLLSGRPYHVDPLVNHHLSKHFTRMGIAVFTLDSLGSPHDIDLGGVRIETVINYHTRMVEAALQVAKNPSLELVQIVSFGCGHDAIISDEMTRILKETSKKEMLILKVDEGENTGPLNIRIKSFIETIKTKRETGIKATISHVLKEAFPIKFVKADRKNRVIYIPNLSESFSYCIASIIKNSGYSMEPLPLAGKAAIEAGKRYVHNDICYPAQVNIGEFLCQLQAGKIDPDHAALGIAKNCKECRAGQYPALARKALDDAGYPTIPIITTGEDQKDMHPGFRFNMSHQWHILWGLTFIDALEKMRHRIRPYEQNAGETDAVFTEHTQALLDVIKQRKHKSMALFKTAIQAFNAIPITNEKRRPRVGITGEILMNYHPTANGNIEKYFEHNGMETVTPNMHDFFRLNPYVEKIMSKQGNLPNPIGSFLLSDITGKLFDGVYNRINREMKAFRFDIGYSNIAHLADNVKGLLDITYRGGEGWKLPAEILEMAKDGVNSFVILQPFGCLPNHITGRGFTKPMKKLMPHLQILSLDYDPDTSFANIENRLQMLIINAREREKADKKEA